MKHNFDPDSKPDVDIKRRQFLANAALAGAGLAAGTSAFAAPQPAGDAPMPNLPSLQMTTTGANQIPQKPLGKTGVNVSVIGLGGHHLGDAPTVDEAVRMVQTAVDAGITFF